MNLDLHSGPSGPLATVASDATAVGFDGNEDDDVLLAEVEPDDAVDWWLTKKPKPAIALRRTSTLTLAAVLLDDPLELLVGFAPEFVSDDDEDVDEADEAVDDRFMEEEVVIEGPLCAALRTSKAFNPRDELVD